MATAVTFGTMKTQVQTWFDNDDLVKDGTNDSLLEDFINDALCEAYIRLEIRAMEKDDDLTVDSNGEVTVPTDFKHLVSFDYGSSAKFEYVELEDLLSIPTTTTVTTDDGSQVYAYTRRDNTWKFRPPLTSGSTLHIVYIPAPTVLSGDSDTDDLMSELPTAIRFGALAEAADYFEDERAPRWRAKFLELLGIMDENDKRQELSNLNISVGNPTSIEY